MKIKSIFGDSLRFTLIAIIILGAVLQSLLCSPGLVVIFLIAGLLIGRYVKIKSLSSLNRTLDFILGVAILFIGWYLNSLINYHPFLELINMNDIEGLILGAILYSLGFSIASK